MVVLVAVKLGLSAALLYWMYSRLPPVAQWPKVHLAEPVLLLACFLIAVLQIGLLAWRWREITAVLLLDTRHLPDLRRFFAVTWLSGAVSQVLPALIGGDGLRVAALRMDGLSWIDSAASVVTDRLFGLLGLTVLFIPAIYVGLNWPTPEQAVRWAPVLLASVLAAAAIVIVALRAAPVIARRIPPRVECLVTRRGAMLLVLAAATHLLSITTFILMARAVGIDLPAMAAFTVFPVAMFASMLPISFGGWGVREVAVVHGFLLYGVPEQDALLASVLFGIFQIGVAIPAVAFIVIWPGLIKK